MANTPSRNRGTGSELRTIPNDKTSQLGLVDKQRMKPKIKQVPASTRMPDQLTPIRSAQTSLQPIQNGTGDYPNVIVFGETGAGKSSVINMLSGPEIAAVASGTKGVTFQSERYEKEILGRKFNVFDTAGFNEATQGTISSTDAFRNLFDLIGQLKNGVSLLVYVFRAGRLKESTLKNYTLFYDQICAMKVPIVIIVTGLEDEADMDQWWLDNMSNFEQHKMRFTGVACITAQKGLLKNGAHKNQEEYDESRIKVEKLITEECLPDPWTTNRLAWFRKIMVSLNKFFGYDIPNTMTALYGFMSKRISPRRAEMEVQKLATELSRG